MVKFATKKEPIILRKSANHNVEYSISDCTKLFYVLGVQKKRLLRSKVIPRLGEKAENSVSVFPLPILKIKLSKNKSVS